MNPRAGPGAPVGEKTDEIPVQAPVMMNEIAEKEDLFDSVTVNDVREYAEIVGLRLRRKPKAVAAENLGLSEVEIGDGDGFPPRPVKHAFGKEFESFAADFNSQARPRKAFSAAGPRVRTAFRRRFATASAPRREERRTESESGFP